MFKDITLKIATVACTIVLSATCVLSAVGPATASGQQAVASTAAFVA